MPDLGLTLKTDVLRLVGGRKGKKMASDRRSAPEEMTEFLIKKLKRVDAAALQTEN